MITEKDLQEAIAECQGVRNPNASTAIKLAAFLTIQREMFGKELPATYSFAAEQPKTQDDPDSGYQSVVGRFGSSDFLAEIAGKDSRQAWEIMDELMDTLQAIMPRLYNGVMRQIDFLP